MFNPIPAGSALLIDAGTGERRHLDAIDRCLTEQAARLDRVLVTHAHADHASGAPAIAAAHRAARVEKHPWPDEDAKCFQAIWCCPAAAS